MELGHSMVEGKGIGEREIHKIRGRYNGVSEAVGSRRMIISERVSQGISSAGMGKNECAQRSGRGSVG